jgi:predicted lipid-binding transport protein (Tim44 family)
MIRRHPLRGLLGGLLIGLGLAILLVIYGAAPLGSWTVIALILLFAVIGTAAAWVLPARSRPVVAAGTAPAAVQTTTRYDDPDRP